MIGVLIDKFVRSALGPERMERFENFLDELFDAQNSSWENPGDPKRPPADRERIIVEWVLGRTARVPHDRDNRQDVQAAVSWLMSLPDAHDHIPGLKKGIPITSPVTGQVLDAERVMKVFDGMTEARRNKILPRFTAEEIRDFREELARQEVTYGDDQARLAMNQKMWSDFEKDIQDELYSDSLVDRINDPHFFDSLSTFSDIRRTHPEFRLFAPNALLVPDEQSWQRYKDVYKQVLHDKIASNDDDPSTPGGGHRADYGFGYA